MSHLSLLTPLGALTLFAEAGAIVALEWGEAPRAALPPEPLLREAANQLQDYFDGLRRDFDLHGGAGAGQSLGTTSFSVSISRGTRPPARRSGARSGPR